MTYFMAGLIHLPPGDTAENILVSYYHRKSEGEHIIGLRDIIGERRGKGWRYDKKENFKERQTKNNTNFGKGK